MNFWGEMTLNVTLLTFSVIFRKVVTQKGDWTCFFQTHQSNANHINNCATLFSSFSSTFSHMSFYNILWSGWHLLATVKSNLQLINMFSCSLCLVTLLVSSTPPPISSTDLLLQSPASLLTDPLCSVLSPFMMLSPFPGLKIVTLSLAC